MNDATRNCARRHRRFSCLASRIAFLFPRVTVSVVAVALPETEAVVIQEHEAADPLDAFPGVEMRNDKAQRAAVFACKRLAVMVEGKEYVGVQQIFERHVGGVAFLGKDEREVSLRLWVDEFHDVGEEDAFPAIIEAAPARDAMKIGSDFVLRKSAKLVPGEPFRFFDVAGNFEVPFRRVEVRDAAVMKHRPFQRERLSRRQTAFGLGFVFQFFACS